jgi:hypothetical protein
VKFNGVMVTATSAGFVQVIVYVSMLFATLVTVLLITSVPFRYTSVMDGVLRSMDLTAAVGHTPPVDAYTSRGLTPSAVQRNVT